MATPRDRSLRAAIVPVVVLGGLLTLEARPAGAQTGTATTATPDGGGVHLLVGGFVGRFDLDDGGRTHLFGGRAGVGLRELLEVTGFYWRGFDTSADSVTADHAWGGEVQLNLNAGFGLAPFVTGGLARVHQDPDENQTAAIAGAGLVFPLGPVLLHGAVRDYMFGVTGLESDASPEAVTHNWLYSAGARLALGSRRQGRAVAAAPPAPGPAGADDAGLRAAMAQLAALRDSLRAAEPTSETRARQAPVDSLMVPRNYQSERRIEVPIPTEGSITLRYGPEPAATPPVVINAPGAAAPDAGGGPAAAAGGPGAPAGASQEDPATQAWIQQVVAAQVADQLARRSPAAPALTGTQLSALADRVVADVVATVLPQLEEAQARRMRELHDELQTALQAEREDVLATVERPADPAVRPVPHRAPAEAPEPARADTAVAAARRDAAARADLAAVVAEHPRFLAAAETHRGPAAVLVDAAFAGGGALVTDAARPAVAAVAELLRADADRRVYIHAHADGSGTELEIQRRSELRAEAVRSLLVQAGVASERLFAIGYGAGRPVAENASAAGRALNRRVEIVLGELRSVAAR